MEILEDLDRRYLLFGDSKIHIIVDSRDLIWFDLTEAAKALRIKDSDRFSKDKVLKDYIRYQKDVLDQYQGQPFRKYIREPGLYIMVTYSSTAIGQKFRKWLFEDVAPAIIRYRAYRLTKEHEKDIDYLNQKVNDLLIETTKLKQDLKKETYPNGGMVYVIEYMGSNGPTYRIGMTSDMKMRKRVYNTHTLHNKPVVYYVIHACPLRLEMCIHFMLYDYKYNIKKSYYDCSLSLIKDVFDGCINKIKDCEEQSKAVQTGGSQRQSLYPDEQVIENATDQRDHLIMRVNNLTRLYKLNESLDPTIGISSAVSW